MLFLVDWLQSNLLMGLTTLVLIGIPVVVLAIVFTRKKKEDDPQ